MKKKKYWQLSQFERDRLEVMLLAGHKQKEIAGVLERDPSTISRELKRNNLDRDGAKNNKGEYKAGLAGTKAKLKRKYSKYQGKKINENDELREYIIIGLKNHWNPDEISGRMKQDKKPFYASKTAIYEWLYSIYGQRYCRYLKSNRYNLKKRKRKKTKKSLIPNRIGIEMRPMGASNRTRYGHWEGDTIVSGKKTGSKVSLTVVHERKSKFIQIRRIESLKPRLYNQAILNIENKVKINSLTMDNGIENQYHEKLNIPTYFCNPYSSWQKGGVENANGMVRRFIPKGADIADYSHKYVKMIENILNNKPRKSLGYKTPLEVMIEHNLIKNPRREKIALRG